MCAVRIDEIALRNRLVCKSIELVYVAAEGSEGSKMRSTIIWRFFWGDDVYGPVLSLFENC